MPDLPIHILLDQNIPQEITPWLSERCPHWDINHVKDLGFMGKPDDFLYHWAQQH